MRYTITISSPLVQAGKSPGPKLPLSNRSPRFEITPQLHFSKSFQKVPRFKIALKANSSPAFDRRVFGAPRKSFRRSRPIRKLSYLRPNPDERGYRWISNENILPGHSSSADGIRCFQSLSKVVPIAADDNVRSRRHSECPGRSPMVAAGLANEITNEKYFSDFPAHES